MSVRLPLVMDPPRRGLLPYRASEGGGKWDIRQAGGSAGAADHQQDQAVFDIGVGGCCGEFNCVWPALIAKRSNSMIMTSPANRTKGLCEAVGLSMATELLEGRRQFGVGPKTTTTIALAKKIAARAQAAGRRNRAS
jgi:hypothetical protein